MDTITVTSQPSQTASLALQQASSDDHLIEMWISRSRSAGTQKAYRRAITRLRAWLAHHDCHQLAMVTAAMLIDYEATFPKRWSDATCNLHKAAIKSLWKFGSSIRYLQFNVPHAVYRLGKPRPVMAERILTEGEMRRAIAKEPSLEAQLFLRFLFATGVRASEALAVRWCDLHLRGQRVFLAIHHGKGDKAREIGCSKAVYDALIQARPEDALDQDEIFPVPYPIAWQWVKVAMARIGKPQASPHWLRHAHAVTAAAHGSDWWSIAQQLGHAKPSFTMDRYAHFNGVFSSDYVDI
jgi:integrase/recombinase XerD